MLAVCLSRIHLERKQATRGCRTYKSRGCKSGTFHFLIFFPQDLLCTQIKTQKKKIRIVREKDISPANPIQNSSFKLLLWTMIPKSLFPGKKIEQTNLGTSYGELFDPKHICFTKAWIRQAVIVISKGYDHSKSTQWKKAIVLLIFCSSESLRSPEVREFISDGFYIEDFYRRYPSRRLMKIVHSWGKISQAIWDRNYPFCLVYEDDSLDENENVLGGGNDELSGLIGGVIGTDGGDAVEDGGGGEMGDEVEKSKGLVIKDGWATEKFGEATIDHLISLVNVDGRDRKYEPKQERKPDAKKKDISPHSGPKIHRGMCTSTVFSSHTFGSVFPSPALVRDGRDRKDEPKQERKPDAEKKDISPHSGWPTAVEVTDLRPRAFLSGPILSTWLQGTCLQTSIRGCPSILEQSSPICKDGIYSASRQMFRMMRHVFRR